MEIPSPVRQKAVKSPEANSRIGISNLMIWKWTDNGEKKADSPKMNATLKMFEPTMLPIARSPAPTNEAFTETASSGELVPKATTVNPITRGLNPAARARPDAP